MENRRLFRSLGKIKNEFLLKNIFEFTFVEVKCKKGSYDLCRLTIFMLGRIHKSRQIKFSYFKEFFTVRLYLCLYKCYSLSQDASNELSQVWGLYSSDVIKLFLNILTGFLNTFQNFQNIFRILASSPIHKYILCMRFKNNISAFYGQEDCTGVCHS